VFDGKGILRVARPGILIDPPARMSGFEEQLSSEQLKASRFLHVWGAGRKRQSHILSRLDDARLDRLAADNWYELTVVTDGGYRYLELENLSATLEEPAELVTKPLPREEDPVAAAARCRSAPVDSCRRTGPRNGSIGPVRRARREHGARAPPAPEAPGRGAPELDPHGAPVRARSRARVAPLRSTARSP
jgi:hypothetical protein